MSVRTVLLLLILLPLLGWVVLAVARRPRADRTWAPDQTRLAEILVRGDSVELRGIRDFDPADGNDRPRYRDEAFALEDVERVWFVLAPFANRFGGLAHTFLSFEFSGERFLAASVEARREDGESYGLVGGIMRQFELAYVLGTERDLIGLRALRGDTLYLYPSIATPEQSRALLEDVLGRAAATQAAPEFYNTLTNNCTTAIRDHIHRATEARVPWGWGMLLPGYSDELALDQSLLDTELPLPEARQRFRADDRAREALETGAENFGAFIRWRPDGDVPHTP